MMEAMSTAAKSKPKHGWSSPLEFIVEKMGAENLRMTQIRLATASFWVAVTVPTLYSTFSLGRLRYVLMLHHAIAAMGLDEGLLMSVSAQEPFLQRLLRPGSVVTPWFNGFLPKRQTLCGAALYALFLAVATVQLVLHRVDDNDVILFSMLFMAACGFDRGLFHSTRPSDILKFLLATLLPQPELAVFTLLGSLYLWSGAYKLRGFFHGFVFPYQFLNLSGVSWLLRRWYLTDDHLPRLSSRVFGAMGTCGEMVIGIGMLVLHLTWRSSLLLALGAIGMHVFIFFFGMGPFRWNVMTAYMFLCSLALCQASGLSGLSLWDSSPYVIGYLFFFGAFIPIVGMLDPQTLGRYFGGYRMATFHFAGNETYRALLIRKDSVPAAQGDNSCLGGLLRARALGYERISEDTDLFTALCYSDGTNVEAALRRGFRAPSGCADFDEFDRSFMLVPITWLNMCGPLLNTKWDESLPVTDRFVELVVEAISGKCADDADLPDGCILEFVAHVVPWLGGRRKLLEMFDLTASQWSRARWAEEVELPWLPSQLAKLLPQGEHTCTSPLLRA